MTAVIVSAHARQRMTEMDVDEPEVLDAVSHPEVDKPDPNQPGRRIARKGRLAVVYAPTKSRRTVCTVLWEGANSREDGPATHVPNMASNRALYSKLLLWGATPGRRRADFIQMRLPDGRLIDVRPPGFSRGNSNPAIADVYRSLGVSAAEFWARTEKVTLPRERVHATPAALIKPAAKEEPVTATAPTPTAPARDTHGGRVYAYYRGHPGDTPKIADVAKALGMHTLAVSATLRLLHRSDLLEKVGTGQYRYRRWGTTDADKRNAAADLAWVTDPANYPPPSTPRTEYRARDPKAGAKALDYLLDRPGEAVTTRQMADALGMSLPTVQQALLRHCRQGQIQRVARGTYQAPATNGHRPPPVDKPVTFTVDEPDPIEALRALATKPKPANDNEAPAPAPVVATAPAATFESVDDEIDALLELIVPGGIKARHLHLATAAVTTIRHLIEATR